MCKNLFSKLANLANHDLQQIVASFHFCSAIWSVLFNEDRDQYVSITDFPLLDPNKDETSDNFRLFEEGELETLETAKRTDFNYQQCQSIKDAVDVSYYPLFGLVAYLREKVNIAPSMVYAIEALPEEIKSNLSSVLYEHFLSFGCYGSWEQIHLGFEINGIVSSECISNNASELPNYYGAKFSEVPPKPTVCDDNTTDIKEYAKGFKYGEIARVSNDELKLYLTRVGPVSGFITYYDNVRPDGTDGDIFYGWEGNEWLVAKRRTETSEEFEQVTYYTEERIPFLKDSTNPSALTDGSVFFINCRHPSAETSATVCPCPTDADLLEADPRKDTICKEQVDPEPEICTQKDQPSSECICPEVASGTYTKAQCDQDKLCRVLTGKTEVVCPCVDGDERAFCITCTAKDTPSSECKCPSSTTGDYTKAQCEEDKASTEKESTGSIRITLSVIIAAVMIPIFALFW
ncbi:MAG: hypothetical protein EZS28_011174 [Streblomastix strix]|uniref:Uncharacterized protein n=1 Tax=Streblomastix strix TaxID=222440 RepID=A0A5J4WE97_9EUKA|nr:MAG: hypothetical protein EZS28_011174 [Streblomastix strix]